MRLDSLQQHNIIRIRQIGAEHNQKFSALCRPADPLFWQVIIQLFCRLSCLFFCVRRCALSISLTLMNKKIHETRFPRKPRLPKSSFLVFAYTNATTTSIHTGTNIAATHRIHPKTIDCFHDLHSFSFSYQLSRHIITLYNICQPFFDYLLLFTHTCPVTIICTLCDVSSCLS